MILYSLRNGVREEIFFVKIIEVLREGLCILWCQSWSRETSNEVCEICNRDTQEDIPTEVLWCRACKVPIIKQVNAQDKYICSICEGKTEYMSADLRPVFPEERLLLEIFLGNPLEYINNAVWASLLC